MQGGFDILTVFNFTAGELPQSALVAMVKTPGHEDLAAGVAEHSRRHVDGLLQVRYSALMVTYSWDRSEVQISARARPRPSPTRMVISSADITSWPRSSV